MNKRSWFLVFLPLASAMPAVARAQPAGNTSGDPTVVVRYGDLDLRAIDGMQALHGRVRQAVTSLCTSEGVRDLQSQLEARSCIEATMERAMVAEARAIAGSAPAAMTLARN
ncbi:MAG: UrcA family protein [Sphingomonadales bacterium]